MSQCNKKNKKQQTSFFVYNNNNNNDNNHLSAQLYIIKYSYLIEIIFKTDLFDT